MLSIAKLEANRRNARRSTGPRSTAGMDRSSKNAMRHGFTATSAVVIDGIEDRAEYAVLLDAVLEDLDARGPVETLLAERVAQLFWRLRRVVRFESERLSQSQREILPQISDLNDMMVARMSRDKTLAMLGMLFLPPSHPIDQDAVGEILRACAIVLTDRERSVFQAALTPRTGMVPSTVAAILALIRDGESALQSIGSDKSNIPALAYAHTAGVKRAWDSTSQVADDGRERRRTEALLLEIEKANIVERYEPRLRRDLSRTLRDLHDLQFSRRAAEARTGPFRQTNPR